ncbi:hypothetical protein BJ742DRAFT_743167 [Cladochytrium replicatum]|nr:hypothetical protein BJ742DRAFT_743167 [Cladochytrium replicatum]
MKLTRLLRAELLQLIPECIDPLDPLGHLLPTALPLQLLPPKIWNVENVRLLKNHGGRCGVIAELVSSHNSDPNTQMKHLRSLRRFDEFRVPSFTAWALLYHEDGNLEMAAKLYETPAADDYEVDPIACNNLAVILQRDPESIRRAEELYRKARRCMHDGRPDMYATVNLGLLLVQEGFDMIKGCQYLSEAADKRFHEASIALACIHYVGHGVEPSVSRRKDISPDRLTRTTQQRRTLGSSCFAKGWYWWSRQPRS